MDSIFHLFFLFYFQNIKFYRDILNAHEGQCYSHMKTLERINSLLETLIKQIFKGKT